MHKIPSFAKQTFSKKKKIDLYGTHFQRILTIRQKGNSFFWLSVWTLKINGKIVWKGAIYSWQWKSIGQIDFLLLSFSKLHFKSIYFNCLKHQFESSPFQISTQINLPIWMLSEHLGLMLEDPSFIIGWGLDLDYSWQQIKSRGLLATLLTWETGSNQQTHLLKAMIIS